MTVPRSILLPDDEGHYSREVPGRRRTQARPLAGPLRTRCAHHDRQPTAQSRRGAQQMTVPRSILLPDDEGHYSREALRLDRESRRAAPPGRHALDPLAHEMAIEETRRRFFSRAAQGIGAMALASLLPQKARAAEAVGGLSGLPHFPPRAKRCMYLHLVGAPPQMAI